MVKNILLSISLVFLMCSVSNAELPKEDIEFITSQAKVLCENIDFSGNVNEFTIGGDAKLNLNKLAKLLANAALQGNINYTANEYEGFIQKDLLPAYKTNIECRQQFSSKLIEILISQHAAQKKNELIGKYTINANLVANVVVDRKELIKEITIESRDDSRNNTYHAADGYTIVPDSLASRISYKRKGSRVNSSSKIESNSVIAFLRVRDNPKPFSGRGKATFEIKWVEQKNGISHSTAQIVSGKELYCGEKFAHLLPEKTDSFELSYETPDGKVSKYSAAYSNDLYRINYNKKERLLVIESCFD